jgi:hypothetical protein
MEERQLEVYKYMIIPVSINICEIRTLKRTVKRKINPVDMGLLRSVAQRTLSDEMKRADISKERRTVIKEQKNEEGFDMNT